MVINKNTDLALFIYTGILIGFSFFLSEVLHLEACVLCLVQRYLAILILFCYFILVYFKPRKLINKFFHSLNLLLSSIAILADLRLIYIQNLPKEQIPQCLPPLDYMLNNFPISKTISDLLLNHGDCAKTLTFLWLPISWWALISFTIIFIYSLINLWGYNKEKSL